MSNATLPANATSSGDLARRVAGQPLPLSWVERMFAKFEDRFGNLWLQRYAGIPMTRVMQTWSDDLSDLASDQIKRGVDSTRALKFPPTLPEFRELCLQSAIDTQVAFEEAVEQLRIRHSDGEDHWSHPAIYWAAVRIGDFDLRNATWRSIEKRWTAYLNEALANADLPPVPPRRVALVAPGKTMVSPEVAKARCEELKQMMTGLASKMAMPEGPES